MKNWIAGALFCAVVVTPIAMKADTLTLIGTQGSAGGVNTFPYDFSVDGSKTITELMCLNMNREISVGETWNVVEESIPTGNKSPVAGTSDPDANVSGKDFRADAWLFSQLSTYGDTAIQLAVWSIEDPTDAKNNSAWTKADGNLAAEALQEAGSQSLIDSGFFNQFELYLPTSNESGWTNGAPQAMIGYAPTAATPEPSSLILLGTGVLSAAGALRRKTRRA